MLISDQDLFSDPRTKDIVNAFASDQKLFFDKFVNAVVKLSQLDVLTGRQGQVRAKCSVPNKRGEESLVASVVEVEVEVEEVVELIGQV